MNVILFIPEFSVFNIVSICSKVKVNRETKAEADFGADLHRTLAYSYVSDIIIQSPFRHCIPMKQKKNASELLIKSNELASKFKF